MPQPVVHFEISAKDQTKITDFYSQLFGWQVTADNPMNYGLTNTKDGELGIDGGIYQQQDTQDEPGIRIYAQVDDAAAYLTKARTWAEPLSNRPWRSQEWESWWACSKTRRATASEWCSLCTTTARDCHTSLRHCVDGAVFRQAQDEHSPPTSALHSPKVNNGAY